LEGFLREINRRGITGAGRLTTPVFYVVNREKNFADSISDDPGQLNNAIPGHSFSLRPHARGYMQHQRVTIARLPDQSALHRRLNTGDFLDCYCVPSSLSPRKAAEIITDFPRWTQSLLLVRRLVTAPFGLSNDGPPATDKVGIFPVESETDTELIAGFNDKHLDFRVSVLSIEGMVYLATWVHTHNIGGKLYLKTIMPFHILISRNALTRVRQHQS
jgi:hypothetical protein